MHIRTATSADAPAIAIAIAAIYAPIVNDTPFSLELEAPSVAEMRGRIETTLPRLPWLVGEDPQGRACGYVYASKFRERPGYQWAVEVTAYVRSDSRGSGVARQLYMRLFELLAELGYCQAVAAITLPNEASVGLHEALGFEPVARLHKVGYKHGAWRDVGYWQRALQPLQNPPALPRAFNGLG